LITFKGHQWCGKETSGKCVMWCTLKCSDYYGGEKPATGEQWKADTEDRTKTKGHLTKKLKVARAYMAQIEKHPIRLAIRIQLGQRQ
jgi:hypothetical protein